jgi:cyclic pyranopterin phosphate synthase
MSELTHVDAKGHVHMVDVGEKAKTNRRAMAYGHVKVSPNTLQHIADGTTPKGDVLATARLAGIMGAKRTSDLIPLCHQVALTSVKVHLTLAWPEQRIEIVAETSAADRTGIEMEALTAVSVAALTLYDMLKAVDKGMVIGAIRLLEKTGGRSGDVRHGVHVVAKVSHEPQPMPTSTPARQAPAEHRRGPSAAALRRVPRAEQLANDDARLPAFLGRSPIDSAYMLGDLARPYAESSTWYGVSQEGALTAALLLFTGLSVPTVLTAGDPLDVEALFAAFHDKLPRRFHGHVRAAHRPGLEVWYDLNGTREMLRMGLLKADYTAAATPEGVEVLGHRDTGALMGLYQHYPDNFFDPAQLDTGLYCGIRVDGVLVSVAGVHVVSEAHDVAAIGNIVTHREHRGQGLATRVVRFILDQLFEKVGHVSLNVEANNEPALACYRKFGFSDRFRFLEGTASLR